MLRLLYRPMARPAPSLAAYGARTSRARPLSRCAPIASLTFRAHSRLCVTSGRPVIRPPASQRHRANGLVLSPRSLLIHRRSSATRQGRGLAPVDLQAIKAAGVTFAVSLIERVIEEQARGQPERAAAVRSEVEAAIGGAIEGLVPGSPQAMELKRLLQAKGLWSQYLEVGIGPDAEI